MSYWKPVVMLIAALLLLIVAALTVNYMRPVGDGADTQSSHVGKGAVTEGNSGFVSLGEFLVNLDSDEESHYLKTSISLKLDKSGYDKDVEARLPEMRHHVNLVLQSRTADELSTGEGKSRLAEAIKEHAEYVMGFRKTLPDSDAAGAPIKISAISEVLFTSFIIQR
ncbi:MAG TPA: flagellar basal body-associated FliL family protein [Gallionella sp.]|nr:flagellar basal body-associated FliL family protein [Gallionella sp.]